MVVTMVVMVVAMVVMVVAGGRGGRESEVGVKLGRVGVWFLVYIFFCD